MIKQPFVPVSTNNTVGNILEMCPHLKSVRFQDGRDSTLFESQHMSPLELESILQTWPKVMDRSKKKYYFHVQLFEFITSSWTTYPLPISAPNLWRQF